MKIHFDIEILMYTEEHIIDRVLTEDIDVDEWCDINDLDPLRKNHICGLDFEYSKQTTLGNVAKAIYEKITDGKENFLASPDDVTFLTEKYRYYFDDKNVLFAGLVNKYLDPHQTGIISVQVLICMDEGEVCAEDGIRYYMKSREQGKHHEAHVHVYLIGEPETASIAISDGRVLAGKMRNKYIKRAREKILNNQRFFYECWNTMTDGLRVDINKALGIIHY